MKTRLSRTASALLPALLILLTLPGCDSDGDGEDAAFFGGSWELTEIVADQDDLTALVLARFNEVIFTFVEDTRTFAFLADVEGTGEDVVITGAFQVDDADSFLILTSNALPNPVILRYQIFGDRVVFTARQNRDLLDLLFDLDLGRVDEVIFVVDRSRR